MHHSISPPINQSILHSLNQSSPSIVHLISHASNQKSRNQITSWPNNHPHQLSVSHQQSHKQTINQSANQSFGLSVSQSIIHRYHHQSINESTTVNNDSSSPCDTYQHCGDAYVDGGSCTEEQTHTDANQLERTAA